MAQASDEQLQKWATDPDCIESDMCGSELTDRLVKRTTDETAKRTARANKRAEMADNPFDPRTEVSADAKHIAGRIVTHLWILFVLLPFIGAALFMLLAAK